MGIPLRVAVHGHFHYPELFDDFITRLRANRTAFDLFLTTTKEEAAQFLRERIEVLGLSNASVALVPNRGRDIGPMLTGPTAERLAGYDIVGHFHGKRSVHVDAAIGSGWRNFLWEHLIGAEHLMMDAVMAAFVADPGLGLVFPEDPHLNDWDDNRIFAEEIAARMGLALPNHFDFPQGTMFWARAKALRPLQDLRLDWEDYPAEPLPIDGSMLHAMERMVPFSTSSVGFRYATTHVPSWVR
jgi:lipopolysaccharide biosynthesis protein